MVRHTAPAEEVLGAAGLVVAAQARPVTFAAGTGLTLLRTARENDATALSLVLAGRRRSTGGSVRLRGKDTGTRERFARTALAGVPQIDSLERQVPVREAVREQVAWALPFYRRVPREIMKHPKVTAWSSTLGLDDLDAATPAGELDVVTRFLVRVLLGLIARRDAELLIVDDVDQLRDMQLRAQVLDRLGRLAHRLPVIVQSVNADAPAGARVLDLRETDGAAGAGGENGGVGNDRPAAHRTRGRGLDPTDGKETGRCCPR